MALWRRLREFLAVGADVISVAAGLGIVVSAVVGFWIQASLHIGQPWLTLILVGVFSTVAGLAGRGLRYLPPPVSTQSHGVVPQSPEVLPSATKLRTGSPIPIPPLSVEAQTNGLNVYIAITNKDDDAAAIRGDAIQLRGSTNVALTQLTTQVAKLPWPMVWIDDGPATRLMKPDETQIISVGS